MATLARQIPRFAVVGVAATLAHVGVATLLHQLAGASPLAANAGGFAASVLLSYLGNLRWTFERSPHHGYYGPRFLVAALLGFAVGQGIILVTGRLGWPFGAGLALVALMVPASSFLLARYWTFVGSPALVRGGPAWLAIGAALTGYGAWLSTTTLNHDVQWYSIGIGRWLDGATLYRDVVEVNPPLAFLIATPPVAAARLLGLTPATCFIAYVLALAAISVAVASRLWARVGGQARTAGLTAAAALALFVYPIPQFGQREHFTLILVLPYLVLAELRHRRVAVSWPSAAAIGAVAALGLALKPHFLLVPALVALVRIWRERRWRAGFEIEHLAMLAVTIVYGLSIPLLFPAYILEVLPMAQIGYHAGYGKTFAIVASPPEPVLGLLLVFLFAAWPGRDPARLAPLAPWAAAVVGFGIAYLVQQKGWFYQRMPLGGCAILLAVGVALQSASNGRRLAALSIAAGLLLSALQLGPYDNPVSASVRRAVPQLDSTSRVYALGQWLRPGVSLAADLGGTWCSRYPALWPLPGAVLARSGEHHVEAARVARRVVDVVVEEFETCRPTVVVVEPPSGALRRAAPAFDYLTFMTADPRFEALWRRYRLAATLPSGHRVWLRTGPTAQ